MATACAAAELALGLLAGRFFDWGRAEALLFFFFRPWLLLALALLAARHPLGARIAAYAAALVLAAASEALLVAGVGAADPSPEAARGLAAGAIWLLVVELLLTAGRTLLGRWGQLAGAGAALLVLLVPGGLRPYERLLLAPEPEAAASRPDLMLMTALPIIWGEGGAFDPESRPAASYQSLKREFDVRPLDYLDAAGLASGRLLLLAQPRALAPEELVALDQWVRAGGRVLILADPRLAWPSELPLGDVRRPPPGSLLGPLLAHWGIRLEARARQGPAVIELAARGKRMRLATVSPGRFSARHCRTPRPDGFVIECDIGRGRALLAADADLLRDDLWAPFGPARHRRVADNPLVVAEWLDALAGARRERIAGRVQWADPEADRGRALLLASLPLLLAGAAALILRFKRVR